jgi:hypothetical protein
MAEHEGTHFDRFLARLKPPMSIVLAIVFSVALTAALIFLPAFTERSDLDSLAFGVTFCWMPAGIVWLLFDAFRTQDNAQRVWGWLGAAILIGLAGMLLRGGLLARGEVADMRIVICLLCAPLTLLPLLPAGYFLMKLWQELE